MNAIFDRSQDARHYLLTSEEGSFNSYLAIPQWGPAPAIVVVQEIFGVNEDMRQVCRRLAALGYVAICPDLYWRVEPGVDLTDKTAQERNRAMQLARAFDTDAGVRDIATTIDAVRRLPQACGLVGIVGYGLGGYLAYLAAARTEVHASVSYYGVGIDGRLDESRYITRPLLMHFAEEDEFVSTPAREKIMTALRSHSGVEIHTYRGCGHAFARKEGAHYNAAAAGLANLRTADFLRRQLSLLRRVHALGRAGAPLRFSNEAARFDTIMGLNP